MDISPRLLSLVILFVAAVHARAQDAPADRSKPEQEVRLVERAWLDAYEKFDAALPGEAKK